MKPKPNDDSDKEIAIALEYDECGQEAPFVSALGRQRLAQEMKRTAARYGVPIYRDNSLAESLGELEEDQAVPRGLFEQVAGALIESGAAARLKRRS